MGLSNGDEVTCSRLQQQDPGENGTRNPRIGSPRPQPLHQTTLLCTERRGRLFKCIAHPLSSGMTLPTALAAPVEAGMTF